MKQNYRDILIQNLAIIIGGVITGLGVRLIVLEKGADEFTANSIFWVINFVFILLYLAFVTFGISLIEIFKQIKKKFYNKNNVEKQEAVPNDVSIDNFEKLELNEEPLQNLPTIIEEEKLTSEVENEISNTLLEAEKPVELSDIEKIRIQAKSDNEKILQGKLDFIVQYTKQKFAPYASDEEILRFCTYLVNFLKDGKIENVNPIKVEVLGTIDLKHFGWNVWNHYKGKNERKDVAKFLKTVFPYTFNDTVLPTIEKQLTSRKNEGLIKIEDNLLQ
ncbi:hypothetical protein SAMN05660493_02157 [Epilithonimonas bovis DSM 19482]|uniref:Mobilization protein n=1 Tax=Epilithonimonas bovis DSM 19482 TaxID=1121284 RepID=A0A1U7PZQ9_9FLAO|nr:MULTISPECIES: hypothetical protein [Chryseobacterium group]MPS65121.1 hypothetical protein [Chryseobacterium sp.]SIT97440.1 hypothetical protein SAMN05660493_02157 [Epilithonimonas bovis DSM 19482]